ncbi:MAG: hypothetical protein KC877_01540 [Candidatus Kaiserbacteria bacterium]|nr:hypothetical protein [Candidatus Kaiserbacteria bacterium]MCB9816220.1 hypothetical protein [Candidatus Nomurabacteria bacterium]
MDTIQSLTIGVTGVLFTLSLLILITGAAAIYHLPKATVPIRTIEVAILFGATIYGFYWLSVKDPYFDYDTYTINLCIWHAVVLVVLQPLLVRYLNRQNQS